MVSIMNLFSNVIIMLNSSLPLDHIAPSAMHPRLTSSAIIPHSEINPYSVPTGMCLVFFVAIE
jgi:hypothetical protein